MARKRRSFRRSTARAFRGFKRYSRRTIGGAKGNFKDVLNEGIYGAGYGVARPYAANLIAPLSNMIPVGDDIKNEAGMGLLGVGLIMLTRGALKDVGRTAVKIESYNITTKKMYGTPGSNVSSF